MNLIKQIKKGLQNSQDIIDNTQILIQDLIDDVDQMIKYNKDIKSILKKL